jgi:RNA polymerase sigma-70 factor (ECF subfamily)
MGKLIELSDAKLLQRLVSDDHKAFRVLYDRYSPKVYSIACHFLKNSSLAEDAVQDVFSKLWMKRADLHRLRDFKAFLNTVCRNHLLNQLKKLAHAERYLDQQMQKPSVEPPHLATLVELNELNVVIATAVNQLSVQQKRVYQLGKQQGFTYDQIADQLQISRETVKTHMSDALRIIRTYLVQHDYSVAISCLLLGLGSKFFFLIPSPCFFL